MSATDESKLAMTVMAVVDDNPANLKLIGALLEDMVQIWNFAIAAQAVERAKQMPFDLILMDIQMPDMDGIRACELIIHQLPHQQQTPVIAVTAHAMAGQKRSCLAQG